MFATFTLEPSLPGWWVAANGVASTGIRSSVRILGPYQDREMAEYVANRLNEVADREPAGRRA